jgi:hypothetical protein
VLVHNALLGSFLQHGQTRKADPANHLKGAVAYELGDETLTVRFQRVYSYAHQKAHAGLAKPANGLAIPGWLFPGAVTRHVAHGDVTAFEARDLLPFAAKLRSLEPAKRSVVSRRAEPS